MRAEKSEFGFPELILLSFHRQTNIPTKKSQKEKKQKTSKILVRNIPFEAKQKEVMELFKYVSDKYSRSLRP